MSESYRDQKKDTVISFKREDPENWAVSGKRILLIAPEGNDCLIQKSVKELENSSAHITIAHSFESGLIQVQNHSHDICILQIEETEESENQISQLCSKNITPVIVLIPDNRFDLGRKAIELGAVDFISEDKLSFPMLHRAMRYIDNLKKAEDRSDQRIKLLELLSDISAGFINLPRDQIHAGIVNALQELSNFLGGDRGLIFRLKSHNTILNVTHEWHKDELSPSADFYNSRAEELFSPLIEELKIPNGPEYYHENTIPDNNPALISALKKRGIKALIAFPMRHLNKTIGVLVVSSIREQPFWKEPPVLTTLSMFSQVFMNALIQQDAQVEIAKREQRFKSCFTLPLTGMALCSNDKLWLDVNDKLADMLGYSREELIGRSWTSFTHPEDLDSDISIFNESTTGEIDTYTIEKRFIHKDGHVIHTELSVGCVKDESGEFLYSVVMMNDITQHVYALQAVQQQQDYLSQIVDTIPHLVYAKDREGKYLLANKATEKWFGRDVSKILGKTEVELDSASSQSEHIVDWDLSILEEEQAISMVEEELSCPANEKKRWLRTIKKPLHLNGKSAQLLGVSTDLTEQKNAQLLLKTVLKKTSSKTADAFFNQLVKSLAKVFGATTGLIAVKDKENNIARAISCFHDDDFQQNSSYPLEGTPSLEILTAKKYLFSTTISKDFPDDIWLKEEKLESYAGVPIRDSENKLLGVLSICSRAPFDDDKEEILTLFADRAAAEIERMQMQEEREKLIQKVINTQKTKAVGDLATNLTARLHQPLEIIHGNLQVLQLTKGLEENSQQLITKALENCSIFSRYVKQITRYSQLSEIKLQEILLPHIVTEAIEEARSLTEYEIVLETNVSRQQPLVKIDPIQVRQAFLALISLVTSSLISADSDLHCQVSIPDKQSLPPNMPSNLKNRKYISVSVKATLRDSAAEDARQTNLNAPLEWGLADAVISRHEGFLSKTVSDNTICINVTLPLFQQESESELQEQEYMPDGYIVILDDEPSLVEVAVTFLEFHNFKTRGFYSPFEAIDWIAEHSSEISLIILDIKMPDLDGENCFDRIQQISSEIPVAILSGYINADIAAGLIKRGALEFFQKPFEYEKLVTWIHNELPHKIGLLKG